MTSQVRPPAGFPVVGVVGGGQLARMMQPPAVELGITLRVLAEAPGVSAAQVVADAPVGDHRDAAAVAAFAAGCDVVTFDHEHVPPAILRDLEAAGVAVRPGPDALAFAQDKLAMRERLSALGVPCPRWRAVADPDALVAFGDEVGWPVILKTPRGGYDGKGVLTVRDAADAREGVAAGWFARADAGTDTGSDGGTGSGSDGGTGEGSGQESDAGPRAGSLLAEERVAFRRELAAVVARSPTGQAAAWPVVATLQVDGVCREVVAPAPGLDPDQAAAATEVALRIAGELGVVGVLAVEMFETEGGVLVNELAMRPHNSGHWSIDGAVTGQFEQHLRAVLDLPLGDPRPRQPWSVMVNVLGGGHHDLYRSYLHVMAHDPGVKLHLYGKEVRAGRKVGHVTVCGDDLADCLARARHAADFIQGVIDE